MQNKFLGSRAIFFRKSMRDEVFYFYFLFFTNEKNTILMAIFFLAMMREGPFYFYSHRKKSVREVFYLFFFNFRTIKRDVSVHFPGNSARVPAKTVIQFQLTVPEFQQKQFHFQFHREMPQFTFSCSCQTVFFSSVAILLTLNN